MHVKKYLAEGLGTLILTLTIGLSVTGAIGMSTPVVAGLTLGVLVYILGSISGAHLNPAVTLGAAVVKKINAKDTIWYLIAQIVGAFLAIYAIEYLGGTKASLPTGDTTLIGAAEAAGAFLLVMAVLGVTYKKTPEDAAGVTIGGSLLIGILIAASAGNGVINPAVAIGIGSISAMYLIAPIIGGVIAAYVYRYIEKK